MTTDGRDLLLALDEIARLLAVEIRTQAGTQAEAIAALGAAGIGPKRIADLLGTSANTVNVALSRSRARRQ
jgi:DNA-binding CsgD family transcriptional regulator